MKAPIMYTFFTLGQILTFMGHKMIKIWPMYKIPYNSSTISPRTNKNVSMCLSWPKDSNNMQHDLLGHIMTLTWPWPKVKVKYQIFKVMMHIVLIFGTCSSLWHQIQCCTLFRSWARANNIFENRDLWWRSANSGAFVIDLTSTWILTFKTLRMMFRSLTWLF